MIPVFFSFREWWGWGGPFKTALSFLSSLRQRAFGGRRRWLAMESGARARAFGSGPRNRTLEPETRTRTFYHQG